MQLIFLQKILKVNRIFFVFLFPESLVDTVKSCEIGNHHDALVYTAGAIKHLSSNNHTVQKELVSLDGIEGLAQILDTISKDVSLPGDLGDFDKNSSAFHQW